MKVYPLYFRGEFIQEGTLRDICSPGEKRPFAQVSFGDRKLLEKAITFAEGAFREMHKTPAHQIAGAFRQVAGLLTERSEEFAKVLAMEAGKPIRAARGEVERAVHTLSLGAEESLRRGGETIPMDQKSYGENRFAMLQRFPLGVIGAITPFNFPLNLVAHKIAPALAAGNTMVLKPASQTPLSALKLAELFQSTQLPKGALQVIPAEGSTGEVLAEDPRVKMLTFTGSADVGWYLKQVAFRKKVALELGGNAGVIVHEDADLPSAAQRIATAAFAYAGQSCISVQRVYAHQTIYAALLDQIKEIAGELRLGDPLREETDVGPMITEGDAVRVEEWVKEALSQGARVVLGGERDGAFYPPTILEKTTPAMKVNRLEVFAPLMTITAYRQFGEAVKAVDDSRYGLQAGIFTRDVERIRYAYENLTVGGVIVGDVPTYRIDHMPYGGVKASGSGREGVRYALEELSEPRLLVVRFGNEL